MSLPLIGISLDWGADPRGRAFGVHQLRAAYSDAVAAAGGVPVLLAPPLSEPALAELLGRLEGVIITGGAFDISPDLYGEAPSSKLGMLSPERTAFERALLTGAERRDLAVLGICGGMQLLNVNRGGTLYQHLPDELPGLQHEQPTDRRTAGHSVQITPQSRLAELVGAQPLEVNSSHHQGVKRLGSELAATAHSSDGLVEAIEQPSARFCLGVEWHPELLWDSLPRHRRIFEGLVAAASGK